MKYLVAAVVAASLLGGVTGASADQWNNGRQDNNWNNGRQDNNWNNGRNDDRWDNHDNRGRWNKPHWSRGDRFSGYGHRGWVVNDYRRYHLRQPPRGYRWVQADENFLLVAVASGVIAQVILGNR